MKKISRAKTRLINAVVESADYSVASLPALGWIGVVGFPLYYVIWEYVFPQTYENLALRLIGCLLFLPFIFINRWPGHLRRYLPVYWCFAFVYALPFFFTYMLLMNQFSLVWAMSSMAAIMLLILIVYHWSIILLFFSVGSSAAWLSFMVVNGFNGGDHLESYLVQVPIYLFSLIAGSFFNYKAQVVRQEKVRVYSALAGNIAHELRTPILSLKSGIKAIERYFPSLLSGYKIALENQLPVPRIRPAYLQNLQTLVRRLDAETDYTNVTIDMILMNCNQRAVRSSQFNWHGLRDTIDTALSRYPFKGPRERDLVHWEGTDNIEYFGSDVLLMHVIFNLIKNALHFIYEVGRGEIFISVEIGNKKTMIYFKDTSKGIREKDLNQLFDPFYTSRLTGQGTGLGLAFCKQVLNSFAGDITCQSVFGKYTEFTLELSTRSIHG